jgi:hypothetical protein
MQGQIEDGNFESAPVVSPDVAYHAGPWWCNLCPECQRRCSSRRPQLHQRKPAREPRRTRWPCLLPSRQAIAGEETMARVRRQAKGGCSKPWNNAMLHSGSRRSQRAGVTGTCGSHKAILSFVSPANTPASQRAVNCQDRRRRIGRGHSANAKRKPGSALAICHAGSWWSSHATFFQERR